MLDWGRSFHKWSMRSLLVSSVVLPLLVIFVKDVLIPTRIWLSATIPVFMRHGAAIENSKTFMGTMLFFYIAALALVIYLFIKNCKRPVEAPVYR